MTPAASWISKKADRCGGDACVRDSRITVWELEAYRRLGLSDEKILEAVQGLTRDDLAAAWAYVADNPDEIARAIRENQEGEGGLVEGGNAPGARRRAVRRVERRDVSPPVMWAGVAHARFWSFPPRA